MACARRARSEAGHSEASGAWAIGNGQPAIGNGHAAISVEACLHPASRLAPAGFIRRHRRPHASGPRCIWQVAASFRPWQQRFAAPSRQERPCRQEKCAGQSVRLRGCGHIVNEADTPGYVCFTRMADGRHVAGHWSGPPCLGRPSGAWRWTPGEARQRDWPSPWHPLARPAGGATSATESTGWPHEGRVSGRKPPQPATGRRTLPVQNRPAPQGQNGTWSLGYFQNSRSKWLMGRPMFTPLTGLGLMNQRS